VEVLHALKLSRLNHATLMLVQRIVWLVNGQIGDRRALRHVEAAIKLALDLSYNSQVVKVLLHALRLCRFNLAILSIVQSLVWLALGQIGDRALNHAEVAIELALES